MAEERLSVLESKVDALTDSLNKLIEKVNSSGQSAQLTSDESANVNTNNGSSDLNQNSSLPQVEFGPGEQFGAANFEFQKEYERVRDSLTRVQLPPSLKVHDSSTGIKQECKGALKVISKCARYSETAIKILETIPTPVDQCPTLTIKREDLSNLFVVTAAQINFLQSEFASLVVRSTFDQETSRIFRSFENNSSTFSNASLHNVRIAAELAAAQSRLTPSYNRGQRGRGFNYNRSRGSWNNRFHSFGGRGSSFPNDRQDGFS